ncbi:MAG: DUF167 domain-containing protein [Burkholderiales bacterium]|nr:DUF167 domain-containing protein [Burkholderiales bacterium]
MRPTGKRAGLEAAAPSWFRRSGEQFTLSLSIQPGARRTEVAGLLGATMKVRIAAPATHDRANAALIEFLSHAFDLPPSRIYIRAGRHARRKLVELDAPGPGAQSILTAWEQR